MPEQQHTYTVKIPGKLDQSKFAKSPNAAAHDAMIEYGLQTVEKIEVISSENKTTIFIGVVMMRISNGPHIMTYDKKIDQEK